MGGRNYFRNRGLRLEANAGAIDQDIRLGGARKERNDLSGSCQVKTHEEDHAMREVAESNNGGHPSRRGLPHTPGVWVQLFHMLQG